VEPSLAGFPVRREALPRTVRLVATARLRQAVLRALVAEEELDALAEIEGATSGRLLAARDGLPDLPPAQLIAGVPHAAFVNAAFAYARPREPNRFNGPDRGAWYAALAAETCVAEVAWHLGRELARVGRFEAVVDYAELFASFAGHFVDLRGREDRPACLDPDPDVGYPAGNLLAAAVVAAGHNGILYPSVRHPGGTCLVALWPHAVQSVAPGRVIRLRWDGTPEPRAETIAG
jgi:RES domain-containing protein